MSEKEIRKDVKYVETVSANRINWGAILGGTTIGLFAQMLLILLGVAIGLTALDPGETITEGAGLASALYLAIATLISVFTGAWSAGRFSGFVLKKDGMLHGIATLSLLTLISLFALAQGIDNAVTLGVRTYQAPQMQQRQAEGITPREQTGAASPLTPGQMERANTYAETTAWIAFLTGLLSLIVAAFGGVLGMRSRPIKDEHTPLNI